MGARDTVSDGPRRQHQSQAISGPRANPPLHRRPNTCAEQRTSLIPKHPYFSAVLADELHHLINWPAGPHGLDELRVESVSLLAWTSELVLAMLGQLEAAQLRQQTAARQRTLLPSRPVAAGSAAAGGTVSLWGARSLPCL